MMTIDDVARAMARVSDQALPGRTACERDDVLRELRRLLAARDVRTASI
jgi:hypothetical protein